MKKYRIKTTHQDYFGGMFRADLSLHLPADMKTGKLNQAYLMPDEIVMECALNLDWGNRSDDYRGFVYRRIALEGSSRQALVRAIAAASLEIETNLHRIHQSIAELTKPLELEIDPRINPLALPFEDNAAKIAAFKQMCDEGRASHKTYFNRDPIASLALPFNHLTLTAVFLCEGLSDGDVAYLDSCASAYSSGDRDGWFLHIGDTVSSELFLSEQLSAAIDWCFKEEIEWLRLTP
jgi:hypothetical protein